MAELGPYLKRNPVIMRWPETESSWSQYLKKIDKIDGKYPAFRSVMTHVVQEFKPVWNSLGEMKFFAKLLDTRRHKVNLPVQIEDIYRSWQSDLRIEGKKAAEQPITMYIIEDLRKKIGSDVALLENTGVYTVDTGQFGFSMDGIATICSNTLLTGNPYRIPLPAPTEENIVHWFEAFVRMIPSKIRKLIKEVHSSDEMIDMYQIRYRELYAKDSDYKKNDIYATWLKGGKMLAPHDGLDGTDCTFAVPPGNLVSLIDTLDPIQITKLQEIDYDLKIFAEGSYAIDFYADELAFIADIGGTTRGLPTNQSLYYPEVTNLSPISLPA
jgi:hypothetical protein